MGQPGLSFFLSFDNFTVYPLFVKINRFLSKKVESFRQKPNKEKAAGKRQCSDFLDGNVLFPHKPEHAPQRPNHFLNVDGLGEETVHAARQSSFTVFIEGVGGHCQNGDPGQSRVLQCADAPGSFVAIHDRHLNP